MPDEGLLTHNVASIFLTKFLGTIYGRQLDIDIGTSDALVSALRAERGETLTLVEVKYAKLQDICFPTSVLMILIGEGEEVTYEDQVCGDIRNLRKWQVLPEQKFPTLYVGATSLLQLQPHRKSDVGIKYTSITFSAIQLNGSVISTNMNVRWSENIAGMEIDIINATFPLSFDFGIQNPYPIHLADISGPWGIPISVDASISVQLNPNQICADLRATWPGGNVGTRGCQGF